MCANSEMLPEVDPVRHTETSLDTHLRAHRQRELTALGKAALTWDHTEPSQVVSELQAALNKLDKLAQEVWYNSYHTRTACYSSDVIQWFISLI